MARSFALRVAAAALVATTTSLALSAWITDTSTDPVSRLASQLTAGAGSKVFVEHGDDHEGRVLTGQRAYATVLDNAKRAGGVCQVRDGYHNADPAGLSPDISRYSITRCDFEGLGIALYRWGAGQFPQFGFDQQVPQLTADGASLVVAREGVRGVGQQLIFGDTLKHVAQWATTALAAQGQPGYLVDCGTHRVGVDEKTVDCIATAPNGETLPARVRIGGHEGLAQVTLGTGPVKFV
ncbi:hypothetical protein [Naasia aerilata]|uniref:Uncharacterized protein n=1 Tax=Naasia aerilata TaxID=1162966 RepID=A0ABM8GEK4_9MICO|nr:hypothetical protein [Naasia aerilata]BDZ46737.1 hypothetical protein GCM10025866_26460 [Naasia aerilata]